jgi:hypothetical protein
VLAAFVIEAEGREREQFSRKIEREGTEKK